jgi:hypothetical protein
VIYRIVGSFKVTAVVADGIEQYRTEGLVIVPIREPVKQVSDIIIITELTHVVFSILIGQIAEL